MYVCYYFISDSLLNLQKCNFYSNIHLVIIWCFKWCIIKFTEFSVPRFIVKHLYSKGLLRIVIIYDSDFSVSAKGSNTHPRDQKSYDFITMQHINNKLFNVRN